MENFDPSFNDVFPEGNQAIEFFMEGIGSFLNQTDPQGNPLETHILPDNIGREDLEQQILNESVSSVPVRDPYPGDFNFRLNLDEQMSGQQWVYSSIFDQLFIRMNSTLVMQFKVDPQFWDCARNPSIVALPVYSTDEHIDVPVNRCTFHSVEDDPQGQAHKIEEECLCGPLNKFVGHVVKTADNALYQFDRKSKRHSVRSFITRPQAGSEYVRIPYTFACKTSCPKGMQRRPIHVIFTLEDDYGKIYGRQKIGVKICSCPKRDKKRQEDDYNFERSKSGNNKRKRPMTDMVDESLIPYDAFLSINNTLQNIKVENNMHREETIKELRSEINEFKRLFNGMKEQWTLMENKFNRINELYEAL